MTTSEQEWVDNVIDFLSERFDCPNKCLGLYGRLDCSMQIADAEGKCDEVECWKKVFTEKIYNPFTTLQGGMTK